MGTRASGLRNWKRVNLRQLAKGKDCQVRIPNCCNFNPETTVLAHLRIANVAGAGQKPPDLVGVWACSNCHEILDRRAYLPNLTSLELDRYTLEALARTLAEVSKAL